jgi:GalNAc-alpha-(1->4)-GalNAc-alpha-(1->3)-diNAcBac-PP-undecaprenol alpha-1,4-N-acetyl-D-galactosaminyltransferase
MNIALVISSLSCGGAERVMSELANGWVARGDTVTLVTLDTWEHDSYALHPRLRRVALGVREDSCGALAAVVNNLRRIRLLRHALLATGAPAVLSFEGRTSALVLLATVGTPLRRIVSERVNPSEHSIGTLWAILRRLSYPMADVLVVQTRVGLPWAKTIMLGSRRVQVISNPVREIRGFVRSGPDGGSHTIVAVGRLVHQKGFDLLLRAFACIAEAVPTWKLVIIGEGEERGALEKLAGSLGISNRIDMPGWHHDPVEVLRTAGLFVMSSRFEGFPNALVEAMACGIPVVSTAWAGATEIITDGTDGLLVPHDHSRLAAAMRRVIDDVALRRRLGRNALAVLERYRLGSVIEQWDAILAPPCERLASLKSCS